MDAASVFGLVALAVIVLVIVQIVRMAWRLFRGDEELVSGGSWGNQFFGRRKERKTNRA